MPSHNDVTILKSLWRRCSHGRWEIAALKGLTLTPLPNSDPTFFRIAPQMELMSERPGTNIDEIAASFGTTDFLLGQSVLPVVAWAQGERTMRCIGTAYVISCTGYVVTAAHVMLDPVERGYGQVTRQGSLLQFGAGLNMGVIMPLNALFGPRRYAFLGFERAHFWGEWKESPLFHVGDDFQYQTDVAICKICELPNGVAHQPLNMSLVPVRAGETVYALGYAEMDDIPIADRNGALATPEFAHEIWVSVGEIVNTYPENLLRREVPAPGPCFDFSARIPGKMSGAPILGGEGAVVRGVVSRSFVRENHAFGAMLAPAIHLPLANGQTIKSLMDAGTEGIAKLRGTGL